MCTFPRKGDPPKPLCHTVWPQPCRDPSWHVWELCVHPPALHTCVCCLVARDLPHLSCHPGCTSTLSLRLRVRAWVHRLACDRCALNGAGRAEGAKPGGGSPTFGEAWRWGWLPWAKRLMPWSLLGSHGLPWRDVLPECNPVACGLAHGRHGYVAGQEDPHVRKEHTLHTSQFFGGKPYIQSVVWPILISSSQNKNSS